MKYCVNVIQKDLRGQIATNYNTISEKQEFWVLESSVYNIFGSRNREDL